jgi:hypothetical protein
MNLEIAKHVAEQTLIQAQDLMRKNSFIEPIFLVLTDESVNQDWPQMEIGTFEGFEVLIEKHYKTSEALVMIFASITRDHDDNFKEPVEDLSETDEENYKCLLCIVHTKEDTVVMQSVYAEENGKFLFINNPWDKPIEDTNGSVFSNPYKKSSGKV